MKGFNKTGSRASRKRAKSWTLLVIGDLGDTTSFCLSKPLLVTLTVCAAAAFILIVFSTVSFFGVRRENRRLKSDLGQTRAQLAVAQEDKDKALVRLMLKEGPVKSDEKDGESSHKPKVSKEVSQAPVSPVPSAKETPVDVSEEIKEVAEASSAKPAETSEATLPVSAGGVSVDRLEIKPVAEGHLLEYRFIVKNVDSQGGRMKGYTFVVLKPRDGSEARPAVAPSTPLDAGRPAIFEKGQYFSITRFKPVQGTFPHTAAIEPFKTATVYVYSETGSLLTEQVYQVDQLSGS
ncbi:MAG: LapA family protein [Thermodesulfobacteriota bacterium]|nr:LapA family protein [Thermodesulfobacteriota bacterium]